MGRACCVSGCNSGVRVPSHKFPKNPKRCIEWINNLNLDHLKNYDSSSLQKFKVCYKHFCEIDYSCAPYNRVLKDTAVPFIENTDIDAITNDSQQQQSQYNLLQEDKNIEQIQTTKLQEKLVQHQIYNEHQHKDTNKQNVQIQKIKEQNLLQQVMHLNNQENKEDPKSSKTIQDYEYRLTKLEEKVDFILNTSKRRQWNRSDLQKITRKAKLTSKVKSLCRTIVKLKRDKRHLQDVLQRFKKDNARKEKKQKMTLPSKSNEDKTD